MTRCEEFYEKVERDGNFCGLDETAYRRLLAYRDLLAKNLTIVGISEGAGRLLISEKDPVTKAKGIEAIGKNISHGNIPTAKQVKQLLENVRKRKDNRGGNHKGAEKPQKDVEPLSDISEFYKTNPPQGEEPKDMDIEEDYYTGDAPDIPEPSEPREMRDMSDTSNSTIVVPQDVTDIEVQMEDDRVVQAAKDLQKQKENERQRQEQKDEREYTDLEEKNENTRIRDELVIDLTDALKKAIKNGIERKYVTDALRLALDNVFAQEQQSSAGGENSNQVKSGGLYK